MLAKLSSQTCNWFNVLNAHERNIIYRGIYCGRFISLRRFSPNHLLKDHMYICKSNTLPPAIPVYSDYFINRQAGRVFRFSFQHETSIKVLCI